VISGKRTLVAALAAVRDALTQNVGLKVLSLIFAFGLFAFLHAQEDRQQRTVPVGVILRLPPESAEREIMTPIPASIQVTLRGSTRAIDSLMQAGIPPIEVDLRAGTLDTLVFDPKAFSLPHGVEITIIQPPSIPLEWQNVITRRVPVQASVTGKPAEGYVVKGEPTVDPNQVTVRGPEELVEVMQFVRLASFDVSGLTDGTYRRRIALDTPPSRVSILGAHAATMTLMIARRVSESRFANRPVEVIGLVGAYTVPRSVDVSVVGPPEVVHALRSEQIIARADVSQVASAKSEKHGAISVKVTVDLAQAEVETQPPTVTVRW
jgi:YbbR domain-containing protein